MKADKEKTKKNLLEAARKEFLAVGYEKASLRKICGEAEVTTGALYFFFDGKKDLFENIIKEPIRLVQEGISSHYEQEDMEGVSKEDDGNDRRTAEEILHLMYCYREEVLLLLNNPAFLNPVVDAIIEKSQSHYKNVYERLNQGREADPFLMHWISHVQTSAFIDLFKHVEREEDALLKVPQLVGFLRGGFFEVLKTGETKPNVIE